jgi:hypothetical protein
VGSGEILCSQQQQARGRRRSCFPVNPKQDVLGQTQDGVMLSSEPKTRCSGTNTRWSHSSSSKTFGFLGYKGSRYKNAMKGLSTSYNCCDFFFFFFLSTLGYCDHKFAPITTFHYIFPFACIQVLSTGDGHVPCTSVVQLLTLS